MRGQYVRVLESAIHHRTYPCMKMNFKLIVRVRLLPLVCLTMVASGAVIKRAGSKIPEDETNHSDSQGSHKSEDCLQIPETILSAVLGPAFNARYMSISDPRDNDIVPGSKTGDTPGVNKRRIDTKIPSFTVEEDFNSVFSNDPAWEVEFMNGVREGDENYKQNRDSSITDEVASEGGNRETRHAKNTPWHCEATVKWIDLGGDYFPRFLRTIECAKSNCWYGYYSCRPKSFTIKLLRRWKGVCVPSPALDEILAMSKIEVADLPIDLKELWIWEERAVNFCCECVHVASNNYKT